MLDSGRTTPASTSSAPLVAGWTPEQIGKLRHMLPIDSTATALFELACQAPGQRVTFDQAIERAGRTLDQGRSDLSQMTKIIRGTWGRDRRWPIHWAKEGRHLVYHASQALADAWNATT
jgi:hypothetical protein